MLKNNDNKKIVFISNTSWYLWNFRRNLMLSLKGEGFQIYAIAPKDKYSDNLALDFNFIELKNVDRKGTNPFKDIKLFFEILNIYKELKPSVVFNFTIKLNIYSSFVCKKLKIKYLNIITGLGSSFLQKSFLRKFTLILYKIAFKKSSKIIFQNEDDHDFFIKRKIISKNKAMIIRGSGIDTSFFVSDPNYVQKNSSKIIFLMISRLLRDKGIFEFMSAAKIVKERFPEVEFRLIGPLDVENPSSVDMEYMKNWSDYVIYCGEKEDVREAIKESNVVVLPSYREGTPKNLLEAMSMGKPIITTDVAGCRQLIHNEENGFLVPVKNIERLADAMIKFIYLPIDIQKEMGEKGRKIVLNEYSDTIVINSFLNLLKTI